MQRRQNYFDEALSDFMHDAASGGAIRHLVDLGYSLEQIMQNLSYPTPRERVQKTAFRYMLESGLLCRTLPGGKEPDGFLPVRLKVRERERIYRCLQEKMQENGEEHVYLSCPFGVLFGRNESPQEKERSRAHLSCLNRREQDYILGIPWENKVMYHRMNDRMKEIGRKLLLHPELGCIYYFIKTQEAVSAEKDSL